MKILVTGAGGFLGRQIVQDLLDRGDTVYAFVRPGRHLDLTDWGAQRIEGILENLPPLPQCDAIIHTGAKAGIWGDIKDYTGTNVHGTQNILDAALKYNIPYLVHTSTPSVVFGNKAVVNADESTPYAAKHLCHYAYTKTLGEKRVLGANSDRLKTIALRPHLIWGEGDNHLVPTILERARARKLYAVGNRDNLIDLTHVKNVSQAHLKALDSIIAGRGCGKAYFISDGAPVNAWQWIDNLLAHNDIPKTNKTIPLPIAYTLGGACEGLYNLFSIKKDPPMTRFLALVLAKDHYFNISAARKELGYQPAHYKL